ncbi:NADH-dependent flavin oxidoreductase, partial [Streptococcus suis]
GAKAILQLTHAGRFSSHTLQRDKLVHGPSPMKLHAPFPHEVKELTIAELEELVEAYGQATRRAIEAGFAGVEISS